ncbi:hypothetical protein LY78DRAFT_300484 [Colletotrichum sublineola]|nr:hypothetical protein LY78DRAFT_300484 [Colletotrichum sublineola]
MYRSARRRAVKTGRGSGACACPRSRIKLRGRRGSCRGLAGSTRAKIKDVKIVKHGALPRSNYTQTLGRVDSCYGFRGNLTSIRYYRATAPLVPNHRRHLGEDQTQAPESPSPRTHTFPLGIMVSFLLGDGGHQNGGGSFLPSKRPTSTLMRLGNKNDRRRQASPRG